MILEFNFEVKIRSPYCNSWILEFLIVKSPLGISQTFFPMRRVLKIIQNVEIISPTQQKNKTYRIYRQNELEAPLTPIYQRKIPHTNYIL